MSDQSSDPTATRPVKPPATQNMTQAWASTIVINVVLPTATYFLLTGLTGEGEVPALLLSGIWPALEICYSIAKTRRVDEFSAFILIGIVVGVLTTVFSGNARAVFLKDSITDGAIGLAFLLSLAMRRPIMFYFGRRFATDGSRGQRDWWDGLWQYPNFRYVQRKMTTVWALALLGEAVIRAILTWRLGTSPMVLVNNVVPYLVIAGCVAYTISLAKSSQRRAQERGVSASALEPPPPVAE